MDILHDVCERLVRAGVPKDVVEPVIDEVREDYGGDKVWVAQYSERVRERLNARNMQLYRDWQRGERIEYLARKYSISNKRVYAIIRLVREQRRPR